MSNIFVNIVLCSELQKNQRITSWVNNGLCFQLAFFPPIKATLITDTPCTFKNQAPENPSISVISFCGVCEHNFKTSK